MRHRLSLFATGTAVAIAAIAGSGAAASAATPKASSSCVPLRALAFRPSGDVPAADPESNGYAGAALTNIIKTSRSQHFRDGGDFADVPVYGVPYEAISPANLFSFALGLSASVQDGVTKGVAAIKSEVVGCQGITHFIVIGYSQGAMAARGVALAAPAGTVTGAFLLGDPDQVAGAQGVYGPGNVGSGFARAIWGSSTDAFYKLPIIRFSYCHSADPICNFNFFGLFSAAGGTAHSDYSVDPGERVSLAEDLDNVARLAVGLPLANPS